MLSWRFGLIKSQMLQVSGTQKGWLLGQVQGRRGEWQVVLPSALQLSSQVSTNVPWSWGVVWPAPTEQRAPSGYGCSPADQGVAPLDISKWKCTFEAEDLNKWKETPCSWVEGLNVKYCLYSGINDSWSSKEKIYFIAGVIRKPILKFLWEISMQE